MRVMYVGRCGKKKLLVRWKMVEKERQYYARSRFLRGYSSRKGSRTQRTLRERPGDRQFCFFVLTLHANLAYSGYLEIFVE